MFISSLVYKALGNFTYYWIGGTMKTVMMSGRKSVDLWTWTKDDALMYITDWDPSAPSMGNCTGVNRNGFWSAIDCKMSNPFVCEFPAKIDYNYEFCDDGWAHFNFTHSCYKKFSVTKAINQSTAESYCVQKGGHLASIHSDEENEFIGELASIGLITNAFASVFWIGGKRDDNSANWRWVDKTAFDYAAFGDSYEYTNYFCIDFLPDVTTTYPIGPMYWNAYPCDRVLNSYLCKKEAYKAL
uniref:C-type lectin domain-containing protein n=1 Tax=Panagrolaimus sp. JU765 TaxID=591449 RepID=A0AC34RT37_9BILA